MGFDEDRGAAHSIRPACLEDACALSALSIEVWLHTYCRPAIPRIFAAYALEAFGEAAIRDRINDPHHHLLVEWVDYAGESALRGYLAWSDTSSPPLPDCPTCEIVTLYVRERHKGLGIGSALLEASYQAMREAGHVATYLTPNS
ncbi:Acetyltransferase (GNAT) family protein [Cohaesibacter sp. ES.047]|uniref:GNAT family N-acetyltransferase n=1 Tax=Cohaesibacter sp. ES.047 TaxID=1798205 RepID=UPI000BB975FA|nr:GNAT family N-acetyltransferase [Cohaesibacter sp. ES.047]SNY92455.1 Acetyltransferase (GNAT) family protein [Cohaesibacter sp. ES.047]